MRAVVDFMRRLHDNNDREWFHANQIEWKRVQAQYAQFVGELIEGVASFDPTVRGLQPKDCMYRIARDTRFSNDKSPYKNWLGAYIAPKGKKSGFAGYYFHIEPAGDGLVGNNLLSAGLYCMEPVVLRSVREEILDNGAEIVSAVDAAAGFSLSEGNKLKRVPVGFPADSPYAEMLKMRDIYLEQPMSEEFLYADRLVERTVEEFRRTQPFIALLNRAVQYAYEEMK